MTSVSAISGGPSPSVARDARSAYDDRVSALLGQYAAIPDGSPVRLSKRTSNLFRGRSAATGPGLDVTAFDGVLSVDSGRGTADVQGMTTYEHLVAATLPHGLLPLCVPQLRTITLGGAVTGMGIESASFRNGCPHESVRQLDVLTGDGRVLTVTPDAGDPHRDLFFGFPNSYGTLGYALRLRIELEPAASHVHLRHVRFDDAAAMAAAVAEVTASREWDGRQVDFCDGTVFSAEEQYLTLGSYTDETSGRTPSDYTGMDVYYRSIQRRREDLLTTLDYVWRWDTDWFWCSRAFGAQRPWVRRMWPKDLLRSDVYWRLIALDRRHRISTRAGRLLRRPGREPVVQDVEVPVERLADFLGFFHREVGIEPVWVCPLRQRDPTVTWPLYELDPSTTYVNVGFWSSVPLPAGVEPDQGRVNRRIEQVVADLGGRKSLYSTSYYSREQFDATYGGDVYRRLRRSYDPESRLLDLYAKCVEGA